MKIVFFYKNKQRMSGALQQFFYLADSIAQSTSHEVYYVNYYNETIDDYLRESNVKFRDVSKLDVDELRGAVFITSLNYCFFLAEMVGDLKDSKILLYDWHAYASKYLIDQLEERDSTDWESMFSFFAEKRAVVCMDSATRKVLEEHTKVTYQDDIIPVAVQEKDERYEISEVSKEKIRVGYLGRLDIDKIYSVINIADNLLKLDTEKIIEFHIIGDGNKRHMIPLERYAGKIRFVFTSYLVGEEMCSYLAENVDVLITMGMAALNGAQLGIPTLLVPICSRRFYANRFVFLYDALGFYLGGVPERVEQEGSAVYTLEEALTIALEDKMGCGERCYQHMNNKHTLEYAAECAVQYLNSTELTVDDFFNHPVVARQFELFYSWKGDSQKEYNDFALGVKRSRSVNVQGRYAKMRKWAIEKLIDKPLGAMQRVWAKHLNIKKYMSAQRHYMEVLPKIQKKVENGEKIRVALTVILDSAFPAMRIYKEMKKDDGFDPVIIVVPDVQRGIDYQLEAYERTMSRLKEMFGDDVIGGYDVITDQYLELGDQYDIVFFSNPYIRMAHPYHHVRYFLDKDVLTCYINYGFFTVKFGREIVKQDFYNYVWKVFIDSDTNYKDLQKTEPIKGKNGVVVGYIQMDDLAEISLPDHDRKCILICPHHTVMGWKALDISNFLSYHNFFLELPKRYPKIDFIFRPHPLLFSNLVSRGIWKEEEIEQYLQQIEELPNMVYDNSGDYLTTFAKSDAIIHDCASFTAEYLFTEKPCCYMLKDEKQIKEVFLPMGEKCMEHYYKAFCEEDICDFIERVVVDGNDPMRKQRELFARKELKFNYPNSAVIALEYIKRQLGM